jgi:hypothetical protein
MRRTGISVWRITFKAISSIAWISCANNGMADAINLLGVCQGGALSLCFAALYPEKIRNLVTMVTPVDFHTPDNVLTHLIRHVDVDLLVDTFGNLPGQMLNFAFLSLSPFRLAGQKYVDVVDILDDAHALKNFLRMEKWIYDSPDQAGEAFRQFAKDFFQQNKLVKGEVIIGGCNGSIYIEVTMPVLECLRQSGSSGAAGGVQSPCRVLWKRGLLGTVVSGAVISGFTSAAAPSRKYRRRLPLGYWRGWMRQKRRDEKPPSATKSGIPDFATFALTFHHWSRRIGRQGWTRLAARRRFLLKLLVDALP